MGKNESNSLPLFSCLGYCYFTTIILPESSSYVIIADLQTIVKNHVFIRGTNKKLNPQQKKMDHSHNKMGVSLLPIYISPSI